MVIRALRIFGWLAGLLLIGIGVSRMAFSLDAIPDAQAVNATVDSESRAAARCSSVSGSATSRRSGAAPSQPEPFACWRPPWPCSGVPADVDGRCRHAASGLHRLLCRRVRRGGLTYWYATLAEPPVPQRR